MTLGLSSTSFGTASVRIAKGMGLFERQGLDVNFTVFESGSIASAALLSGSIRIVLSGFVDALVARSRGQRA